MTQKIIQLWVAMWAAAILVSGCGGDEIRDFIDPQEVRLASLEVVAGGTLQKDGDEVEEFVSDDFGPYQVVLDSQDLNSVTLRATTISDDVELMVVEAGKEENATNRETVIPSGEAIEVEVNEGTNFVFLRVTSNENASRVEYVIQIDRVSTDARLGGAVIEGVRSTDESSVVDFDQAVSGDVTTYNISIDQGRCDVSFVAAATDRFATVRVNGVTRSRNEVSIIPLTNDVASAVVVDVIAQDGVTSRTYTFNITRNTSNAEEIAQDARLASLTLSEGRVVDETLGFFCDATVSEQLVDRDTTTLTLTALTSRSGATMQIGRAVLDEDGVEEREGDVNSVHRFTDEVALVSGESFEITSLEEGRNSFVIVVTAPNNESRRSYVVRIVRGAFNDVFVTNAEELQQALRNAQPNDSIVIAAGDYAGLVSDTGSESGSGHLGAHFYSAASGTEEEPIIVTNATGTKPRLLGDDLSNNAVLLLEGQHWEVFGIEISGAQNGVVLDGASNVSFNSIDVLAVGERAVVMQNGSSNNLLIGGRIDRTGLMPETRDGISEVYGEGVVIGSGEGASSGNSVRNVNFGLNIAEEAIDIKPQVANTQVQFNIFASDNTLIRPVDERAIVRIEGSETELSFNQFDYNSIADANATPSQIIAVNTVEGSQTHVYQNNFALDAQVIPVLNNSGAGAVLVTDNVVVDGTPVYEGAVDDSFVNPVFQLQSTVNEANCVTRKVITVSNATTDESVTHEVIVAAACNAEDAHQHWRFDHDEDGYIFITPAAITTSKLRFAPPIAVGWRSIAIMREDSGSSLDDAFFLRWRAFFNGDEISFSSKSNVLFFLVEDADYSEEEVGEETPITVEGISTTGITSFKRVPL